MYNRRTTNLGGGGSLNNVVTSIIYQEHFERSSVRNVCFRTYLFRNSLLHNNVFIVFVLNFVREFRHKYGHSKAHNNEFIRLVLNMSRQFRHKNVQSRVGKSMFHFIRHFSYVSKIHFLFNQSYLHYYFLLWFLFRSYRSYRFQLDFILFFYLYKSKFKFYISTIIHLLE